MKLEAITRSPMSTILSNTITGLATIRASNSSTYFQTKFEQQVYRNARAQLTFNALSRTFGFYLDAMNAFVVVCTAFLAFAVRDSSNVLLLALAIQIINALLAYLQFMTRTSSELENYLNSVNRCLEYAEIPSEPPLVLKTEPADNWVHDGAILFD